MEVYAEKDIGFSFKVHAFVTADYTEYWLRHDVGEEENTALQQLIIMDKINLSYISLSFPITIKI